MKQFILGNNPEIYVFSCLPVFSRYVLGHVNVKNTSKHPTIIRKYGSIESQQVCNDETREMIRK